MNKPLQVLTLIAALGVSGAANAALVSRQTKWLWIGTMILVASASPGSNAAYAADVHVYTAPSGGTYIPNYNPRASEGLLTVASSANDVSSSRVTGTQCGLGWTALEEEHDTMAAAAYGSDSSIDGTVHPGLLGEAVEPMVEASVRTSITRTTTCGSELPREPGIDPYYVLGLAYASASGSVNHRVVARAYPPELAGTLDPLREIPVKLDYALSATAGQSATALALFDLSLDGNWLLERRATPATPDVHGTLSTVMTRSDTNAEYLYKMTVQANVSAFPTIYTPNGNASAEAQAVVDPYLHVDPTWEYAQYFVVEQESVLNPGGWAEVTRAWQPDTDGDGVPDSLDNCTTLANANQLDTDGDGYGNRCDADFDNNGIVNFADLAYIKAHFGTNDANADLDGNGIVNFADLAITKSLFGKAPGPSGLVP